MGVLDDAIRDHLELKRQHGASPDEIAREEAEALGPARRDALSDADAADPGALTQHLGVIEGGALASPEAGIGSAPELVPQAPPGSGSADLRSAPPYDAGERLREPDAGSVPPPPPPPAAAEPAPDPPASGIDPSSALEHAEGGAVEPALPPDDLSPSPVEPSPTSENTEMMDLSEFGLGQGLPPEERPPLSERLAGTSGGLPHEDEHSDYLPGDEPGTQAPEHGHSDHLPPGEPGHSAEDDHSALAPGTEHGAYMPEAEHDLPIEPQPTLEPEPPLDAEHPPRERGHRRDFDFDG